MTSYQSLDILTVNINSLFRDNIMKIDNKSILKNTIYSFTDSQLSIERLDRVKKVFGPTRIFSTISRSKNPKGGCTLIFPQNYIEKVLFVDYDHSLDSPRYLSVTILNCYKQKISFITTYLPTQKTVKLANLETLAKVLETVCLLQWANDVNPVLALTGDFNLDLDRLTHSKMGIKLLSIVNEYNLHDFCQLFFPKNFSAKTFIPHKKGARASRLDGIFLGNPILNTLLNSKIVQFEKYLPSYFCSDHYPVHLRLTTNNVPKPSPLYEKFDDYFLQDEKFMTILYDTLFLTLRELSPANAYNNGPLHKVTIDTLSHEQLDFSYENSYSAEYSFLDTFYSVINRLIKAVNKYKSEIIKIEKNDLKEEEKIIF